MMGNSPVEENMQGGAIVCRRSLPLVALFVYLGVFAICAISPYDRSVWVAENAPIVLLVGIVCWCWRLHRFTNFACLFMLVLPVLHTIGGHFTFERVPFGIVTELFGFERNHFDRLAHFSVGFYAYGIAEILAARGVTRVRWALWLFPVSIILAVAAGYEVFEWLYAIRAEPGAGIAVLGSQGDVWDAQKDMLADGLGAIVAATAYLLFNRRAAC